GDVLSDPEHLSIVLFNQLFEGLYVAFARPVNQQNIRVNFFSPLCLDDRHV
ncbi:MAG: hypothetical protein QOE55_6131, partial [Acidobacteriaceae bacterium]|nr:hypothetical protein [Acidobacteriaceae bacterium]